MTRKPGRVVNALVAKLLTNRNGDKSRHLYAIAVAEDISTCHRARELFRNLVNDLGEHCEVIKHLWLLPELRFPELKAIAADEVFSADLVVISVHGDAQLPVEITEWIELWMRRTRDHTPILLVLLDNAVQPADPWSPMHPWLDEIARKGNLELFVQAEELSGRSE